MSNISGKLTISCAALDQLKFALAVKVAPLVLELAADGTVLNPAVTRTDLQVIAPALVDDLPVCKDFNGYSRKPTQAVKLLTLSGDTPKASHLTGIGKGEGLRAGEASTNECLRTRGRTRRQLVLRLSLVVRCRMVVLHAVVPSLSSGHKGDKGETERTNCCHTENAMRDRLCLDPDPVQLL